METEYTAASTERVQLWAKRLWVEMPREIFWGRMMKDNDQNAIIEVRRDLEGLPGDVYNYSLSRKLTGAGVTGDNQLEGSEEVPDRLHLLESLARGDIDVGQALDQLD